MYDDDKLRTESDQNISPWTSGSGDLNVLYKSLPDNSVPSVSEVEQESGMHVPTVMPAYNIQKTQTSSTTKFIDIGIFTDIDIFNSRI